MQLAFVICIVFLMDSTELDTAECFIFIFSFNLHSSPLANTVTVLSFNSLFICTPDIILCHVHIETKLPASKPLRSSWNPQKSSILSLLSKIKFIMTTKF